MAGMDLGSQDAERDYVFAEDESEYMVRSKTRKLLLHRDLHKSMFFNLTDDPLEKENLFSQEKCQAEISSYRGQLLQWSLFDSRVTNHLDYDAPQCRAEKVPSEAKLLYPYFKKKMEEEHGTCEQITAPDADPPSHKATAGHSKPRR